MTIPLILSGHEVVTSSCLPVLGPDEKRLHDVALLEDLESSIPQICRDAHEGFETWQNTPAPERAQVLRKAAELMRQRKDSLKQLVDEIGSSPGYTDLNWGLSVSSTDELANLVSQPEGSIPVLATPLALTIRTPIGPVYSLPAWNAPLILANRSIAAPLAAGCSVVVRAPEKAPRSVYLLVKCYLDAGVPAKALQLVHVSPDDNVKATDLFLANKFIRKVNFTGSTAVGREIAKVAARYLKPCLLELGGKNYQVVLDDAVLEKAAASAVWSATLHKGQVCMCVEQVFVLENNYEEFLEILKQQAAEFANSPDMALPQREPAFAEKIHRLVKDAVDKGATIVFGSNTTERTPPVILTAVTPTMDLSHVESFGPVLTVHKYSDEAHLLQLLNDNEYGLKALVWSRNVVRALALAKRIECGGVHINSSTVHDEATLPHGGVKASGYGRFNGSWGIDEFSYVKTITLSEP